MSKMNNLPYKSVFSYYGGKGKMAQHYPAPTHDLIIEPFAGAAAYAWRYHERDVFVNDVDERTFAIWSFLTRDDALDIFETYVPKVVKKGQKVSEILGDGVNYPGLVELCRAEANQATQGAKGVHEQITSMCANKCWGVFVKKMPYIIPRIAHWKIGNVGYEDLPNEKATWFIDPPYANVAGARYRQNAINYGHLSEWCQGRWGQVIVCENEGADWLPFTPIDHKHLSIRSRYQRANAKEVVWLRD
jgi:16S rRNA G966 N2-methylase RsmD